MRVMLHFGTLPCVGGCCLCSPPPPPPPALSLAGGSLERYSEMSTTCMACTVGCTILRANGQIISTATTTCTPTETICATLYSRRLAQSGRTGTGLLVSLSGGSLGGEIRSRKLRQKTRYVGSRSTTIPEAAAPLIRGVERKNDFRLSEKLLSIPSV